MGEDRRIEPDTDDPTFYARLPLLDSFIDATSLERYHPAPDDWAVVISDVEGSTRAIEAGRYKDVNAVGVASIVAIQNALPGIALPFVFVAGVGFIAFFIATAWLLGKEYFELAAMRFRSPADAKAMRRDNAATVFMAGLIIAAFVAIPIVNLATPLFGMAFMVHMHKRLSGPRPELIEPARREMSAR